MRQTRHQRNRMNTRNRFKEHLAAIMYHRDKPVASHFTQAGHSIHKVRVKGLWLLFTDNARDRKDMESYLSKENMVE